jgi:hypothetical protein
MPLVSQIAADFESMTPRARHATAIKLIHVDVGEGLDLEMSRMSMRVCRELLKARVPCALPGAEMYAAVTLLAARWPSALAAETAALTRDYIRAGYFRLNDRVDAFGAKAPYSTIFEPGRTSLEVAIRQSNIDAAVVLIDEGERVDFVPRPKYATEPAAVDLIDLARIQWSSIESVGRLREAVMRRVIAAGRVSEATARGEKSANARRSMSV